FRLWFLGFGIWDLTQFLHSLIYPSASSVPSKLVMANWPDQGGLKLRANFLRPKALLFVLLVCVALQNRASLAAGAAEIPSDRTAVEHALNRLAFGAR